MPALLLPRPTLVISPLIALMQDQLDGLPPAVYPQATLINSSLDFAEVTRRLEEIEAGTYRLIYAAPERLRQQEFLRLLQRVGLSLVVVDEAHCISVWGHDFRPDYLFIRKALEMLEETGNPPTVLALTATATTEMQSDIGQQLGRELAPVSAPLFRPNLRLEVFPCANADAKMRRVVEVCRETAGAGIIYANSRDPCEQLAGLLNQQGISAAFYHAGLDRETRNRTRRSDSCSDRRASWSRRSRSAWAWTKRTCVSWSTLPCPNRWNRTRRKRGGRGATANSPGAFCWSRQRQNQPEPLETAERSDAARCARHVPNLESAYRARNGFRIARRDAAAKCSERRRQIRRTPPRLRVAISMLERCGLAHRHLESGYAFQIEIPPAPPTSRAELDALLEARRQHEDRRIADMLGYAEGGECRHVALSRHFDQTLDAVRRRLRPLPGNRAGGRHNGSGAAKSGSHIRPGSRCRARDSGMSRLPAVSAWAYRARRKC